MSKPIYLIFSQLHNLKPKLFKSIFYVQKRITQNPQYKLKQIDSQGIAKNVLQVYQIQHKKYLLSLKKEKVDLKIYELKKQKSQLNSTVNCAQSITTNDQVKNNNQQHKKQQNEPTITPSLTPSPTITQPKQQQSGIIKPKLLQQLIQLTKPLLNLTPSMPTLLQNFTPTPIFQSIPKNGIFTGYFDGCSKFNPGPASVGYYMTHSDELVFQACWPLGTRTNNQAEFSALLFLLTNAYVNGIRRVRLFGDSKLVVDAVNSRTRISNDNIIAYYQGVEKIISQFSYWKLEYVERKYNTRADKLSNIPLKTSKKRTRAKKTDQQNKKSVQVNEQ